MTKTSTPTTAQGVFAARRTYWPAFTVERTFRAPVAKVWKMWTTKKGLEAWYWPEPLVAHVRKLDVRAGGSWEIAAEGLQHTSRGVFTEVVTEKRIGMLPAWCRSLRPRGHHRVPRRPRGHEDGLHLHPHA